MITTGVSVRRLVNNALADAIQRNDTLLSPMGKYIGPYSSTTTNYPTLKRYLENTQKKRLSTNSINFNASSY